MKCANCDRKLKGGFEQEDKTFLCASCIIARLKIESLQEGLSLISKLCESSLVPGVRPTKLKLRNIRDIANAFNRK